MESEWGNGKRMRKWTENEEMERDFLSFKQFPLFVTSAQ